MSDERAREIADGMSKQDRNIALALLGNSWDGYDRPSPGIMRMNTLGLIHIDATKNIAGQFLRFKARPTDDGLAVRRILEEGNNGK